MQAAEADDEACLAGLMRLMDHIVLTQKYEELKGQGSKIYRDEVIVKAFKLIVGKDGDLEKLLFRWFNRKTYFKTFREALIAKVEGLFTLFYLFIYLLDFVCTFTAKYKKTQKVPRPWKDVHSAQYRLELEYNNYVGWFVFNFFRPSCNFGSECL
jgi:hypothetical protein